VSTLTLCSVDDQRRAVGELRRVLRPGGRLLFVEHLRAEDERVARMQDRMNWFNRLVVCCDCNRPTLDTLCSAGFVIARSCAPNWRAHRRSPARWPSGARSTPRSAAQTNSAEISRRAVSPAISSSVGR
jgi:ubiquinone/menaquinone biosynthesis C-methylase UbiE